MASLKKRGDKYYVVFSRRVDGAVEQRAFSLDVGKQAQAERLKLRFEDQYRLGEIDPFNGWSPRKARVATTPQPAHGLTLSDASARFLASRSHVRQRTLDEYEAQVRRVKECIGASMPVKLITDKDIRAYAFQPHLSTASQTTYLRFCRMVFRWLTENRHVDKDVCSRVRYPKRDDRVSDKTITPAQLRDVLAAQRRAEHGRTLHPWFRPMMATFFYAGLRAREGVELRWEKVDFEAGYLRVTGSKSGRERRVPLRTPLQSALAAWHRYSKYPGAGLVFPKARWQGKQVPLTTELVSKTFKRYAREAKLPDSVNLHGLRHSCATELLRLGIGINVVATILGHSSLEVTRIYEHLNERDLKAAFARLRL